MRKYSEFINENQTFNFDKYKTQIIQNIQKLKKGEKLSEIDNNTFYHLLRNTGNVGDAQKLGLDIKEKWKKYFTSFFDSDGVWAQRNFNKNLKQELKNKSGGRTYNYYLTLSKTKDNILLFWGKLNILDKKLMDFSNLEKTPISYKTHAILDALATDNDSLKVYYYDIKYKNDVEIIIKQWLSETNIKTADRTHTHGVDINGISFGQKTTQYLSDVLSDFVKKHGNKYSDEQYYDWFKHWLPDLIEKIKIKEI